MPLKDWERSGISDLFEEKNIHILRQVAKNVTKGLIDLESRQKALDYIYVHSEDSATLLNKKCITKEILFKYLHEKEIAVTVDFTKYNLVQKIITYWYKRFEQTSQTTNSRTLTTAEATASTSTQQPTTTGGFIPTEADCESPIHLLARKFAEWFFELLNKSSLKLEDFWTDASLLLEISVDEDCNVTECQDSTSLLHILSQVKNQFGFFYNPNLSYGGVQGRIEKHGMVLVLACGTLHTQHECVGIFECVFGLLRDPFADNNWKAKRIQLRLRSTAAPSIPSLEDSDCLKEIYALPVPEVSQDELT
uniref:H cysteine-type endopeptidase n=1 Tax=Glossina morsitans morsitans TaxID=37546 RepID=D3TQS7_GLOMM